MLVFLPTAAWFCLSKRVKGENGPSENSHHLHAKTFTKASSNDNRLFPTQLLLRPRPGRPSARSDSTPTTDARDIFCRFRDSELENLVARRRKHAAHVVDYGTDEAMSKAKKKLQPTDKNRDWLEAQIRCTGTSNRVIAFASRPTRLNI